MIQESRVSVTLLVLLSMRRNGAHQWRTKYISETQNKPKKSNNSCRQWRNKLQNSLPLTVSHITHIFERLLAKFTRTQVPQWPVPTQSLNFWVNPKLIKEDHHTRNLRNCERKIRTYMSPRLPKGFQNAHTNQPRCSYQKKEGEKSSYYTISSPLQTYQQHMMINMVYSPQALTQIMKNTS